MDYYTRLGSPFDPPGTFTEVAADLFEHSGVAENASQDWEIIPAVDPTSQSDRIRSLSRAGLRWWMKVCVQTSPTGGAPRQCTLRARVDDGAAVSVVAENDLTLEGNNDRQELVVFYDGLGVGEELFFDLEYLGGPAVLSFNSGSCLIASS